MGQYLPIQAINRSQRVRIGGKTILPNVTSYIDLGQLSSPAAATLAAKEAGKKAELKDGSVNGFKKKVFFAYYVTAVDSAGNETLASGPVTGETGNGAEAESELNFEEVKWNKVDRAVKYNIYRTGAPETGDSTAAKALLATPKLVKTVEPATPNKVAQTYVDTGIPQGTQELPTVNGTQYNTSGTGWSTKHELQNHLALGAIIIVGGLTPNPNDYAPFSAAWTATAESEKVKFAAVEVVQRSTGAIRSVAEAAVTKGAEKTAASKERFTIYVYNVVNNTVESVQGKEIAEKTNATVAGEKEAIEAVEKELKASQIKLLVVRTTNSVTTPEIISGQDTLTRVSLN